jgi:hypothetical protein
MPPRPYNEEPRQSTCDNLRELCAAYMPTLRFASGERFYPVRAESWLTHTTSADWPETAGRHGDDLSVDTFRHGTALVRGDSTLSSVEPHAGTPPLDRPLSLDTDLDDPGNPGRYDDVGPEHFLSFGGWTDPDTRERGNADYLRRTFSELAGAMDPDTQTWEPAELDPANAPHLPSMWVPQPVTPTVYAEVEWAGMFPRWCMEAGGNEFCTEIDGATLNDLDQFLAVTYHYFYAHRHPVDAGSGPAALEGQWEAVSLFFRAKPSGETPSGRPAELYVMEPPRFVVVSQGATEDGHRSDIRRWDDVLKVPTAEDALPDGSLPPAATDLNSTSCLLFVGRGTHFFHFDPTEGHDWADEPAAGSGLDLSLDEDVGLRQFVIFLAWMLMVAWLTWVIYLLFAAAFAWLALAAIATALAALLAALLVLLAALLIIALLAILVLWLIVLLSDHGSETEPQPHNEEAGGDGPEAGPSSEPPAGDPHSDVTGGEQGTAQPAGTPNAGSPSGRNSVAFDLRVVDVLNHHDSHTGFPPEKLCEHPAWWRYAGGWGVRVPGRMASGWTSGMRRVDERHRSWAYYNAALMALTLDAE